ncbi:hypothetical protein DFO66_107141 [Brevibacterium sanguinis]|uniref:Uncharacterized protein n=2 Tax=Brevibacterium TaxID=1696 RepID=A0A366IKD6_9MICO|nr:MULTISPECIES: hypothetical protein [Brevibacterium]RBP64264.1 hypothetical protein DFO66_107141 [Brevibacterium sanguinis]RBP71444.1 hypothetical protein DFO65_10543 [Brevibacterium celere]
MSLAERLGEVVASDGVVDLQTIGSVDEIATEAAELAAGPYAPLVADAIVRELNSDSRSEAWRATLRRFAEGLGSQQSYLALRESADFLLGDDTLDIIGPTLHDVLLPTLNLIATQPLLAGLRLNIVLDVVATTGHAPYRVLDILTQPVDDLPREFDDPLARAIGVAVDLWTTEAEQRRFAATLDMLTARGSDDAAYERALQQLRQALEVQDQQELLERIRHAHERFEVLASKTEDRSDAQAFASSCRAIVAFHEDDEQGLRSAALSARETANRRAILLHGMHSRDKILAGQAAGLAWTSLAWHLESALEHFSDDTFLDTWAAVAAITKVYEADRQFSDLHTIHAVIQPRIVNDLATRHAMAHQLQRAVEVDRARDNPMLANEIYELADLAHQARSAPRESDDDSEEDSQSEPYLHALLGPAAGMISELPDDKRAALEESAHQTFVGTFAGDRPTNELVSELTASLMAELSNNPTFTGSVKSSFSLLILNTLRFLVYVGDNRQPYTLPIDADHPAPLETKVQEHFAEYLSGTELAGRVGLEHSNVAIGRADVIVTFDGAQRYVTEVKRELADARKESIESAYLAQALEYQSTNQPFGQLLVLDLTDHSGGTPHVTESVWVTHRRDASQRITASAIVAVVRGNRPTPSAMK